MCAEAKRMPDVREQVERLAPGRVQAVAQAALAEPGAALVEWRAAPLKGSLDALDAARSVFLFEGTARIRAAERPWCAVLKVLAPAPGQHNHGHADYWRREQELYGSGMLESLPARLRAPRCYGCDELPSRSVWLWLEHVHDDAERPWRAERWAQVARQFGRFNGAYLVGLPLPSAPALGGRRLRTSLGRYRPLVAQIAAAPHNAAVAHWWPESVVAAILRLWEERESFCAVLERLPQTFCHGDAIARNLLARRLARGADELVAIDWECAGYYAAGEEVGQTLSVAAAFYDIDPAGLPALDEALFTSYLDGLRDTGWRGEPQQVRLAYVAHAALRNAFNAVGATGPSEAGRAGALQVYGHTWEELAERRAAVRPFLLTLAAEARGMLADL
jgi:hypothetical protein